MSPLIRVSKVPAVLVSDARTSNLKIAGLTLMDRMVVSAHRAGCAPIFVVGSEALPLKRATELGIATTFTREIPKLDGFVLRMDGSVLLEPRALERAIAARERLRANITDAASGRAAERELWDSLGSSADGIVDRYFNRPVGRILSKLLVHAPVSPNHVSLLSILIGVASAPFFAAGNFVAGALLLQLCAIVDCVDGELARVLFKESRLGQWLDLAGDQVVHVSVFAAIGIGVARLNPTTPALALGVSAAIGVLFCFLAIIRAGRRPAEQRHPWLNKLLAATANRDFSVLLLALALLGRMDLFLWLAGIGIHVFWIALLMLQIDRVTPAVSREVT